MIEKKIVTDAEGKEETIFVEKTTTILNHYKMITKS